MPRATAVNSTWVGELASAVSIGGSSCTLSTVTGTNWPSSGTFAVQIGEDPDTDAELVQVTRSGATLTLDSMTFAKAHSAGAKIYYLLTAEDVNGKITDPAGSNDDLLQRKSGAWTNRTPAQVKADLALTKSDVGLSNVTNDAQLPLAGGTMVGALTVPSQTPTTTALRIQSSQTGIFGAHNVSPKRIGFKVGNVVVLDTEFYSIGAGATKVQNLVLRAEGGFSSGVYETDLDGDFLYVAAGGKVLVDSTAGALDLTLADDISDPAYLDYLRGAEYLISDAKGQATTNNIRIDGSLVGTYSNGTTLATINTNGGYLRLCVDDSIWQILDYRGVTFS